MNKMTNLLNKIERRLGTNMINLPDNLAKKNWSEIIKYDTISTFSRYLPNSITVLVNTNETDNEGYSWVDTNLPDNITILGIRDIDWSMMGRINGSRNTITGGYGYYDALNTNCYSVTDIGLLQARADLMSFYNTSIYPEFKYPNKIRFKTAAGGDHSFPNEIVPVTLLVEHSIDLSTIEPTKMEIFENLATADIASYLYENLKYFDNLETVFANVDIKIDSLKDRADRREEIITKLEDGYVSAANTNQPLMYTV